MTIHVLVEGTSDRSFIEPWTRRFRNFSPVKVHPHQGKGSLPKNLHTAPDSKHRGLLDQLPAKLRAFDTALDPASDHVVVLIDADADDVITLEASIEGAAAELAPKLTVVVSLAIEETEAFYLGDLQALRRAFPEADMERARAYVPDSICGTWEIFGEIVHDDGGNKVAWAEAMGPVITTSPRRSRSPSFRKLLKSLRELVPSPVVRKKPRRGRHPPKNRRTPGRKR